jgi:hypothetical protein
MPTLQVERRSRYGNKCWLPANDAARAIAEIAGTTEVRTKDLVIASRLGLTVARVERRTDGTLLEVERLSPEELKP